MGRKRLYSTQTVLEAIERWILERGVAPTIEELRLELRMGSTRTVLRYLNELEESGAIERWSGARGIRMLRSAIPGSVRTRAIPVVGEVAAGALTHAEQNIDAWLKLPESMLSPASSEFFFLRVRGHSMNRAHLPGGTVEDGDLVLVRREPTTEHGAIVVALVDGEATLKRLVRGPGYFLLKPESDRPEYQPIMLEQEALIQGTAIRVLKQGGALLGMTFAEYPVDATQ